MKWISVKQYLVIYLLDGDSLFPILATNHLFLHYDDKLPEAIIVGIAYGSFDPSINKRGFDFSAPAADANANQGGAPHFQRFLETERLPEIDGGTHAANSTDSYHLGLNWLFRQDEQGMKLE